MGDLLPLLFRRRTSPTGWFGVKAHWTQFAPIAADPDLMRQLDVQRYVRLSRSDTLAQAISLVMARQTSAWISFHPAQRHPTYDFAAIRGAVDEIVRQEGYWTAYFAEAGVTPVEVSYEALIADPADVVAAILRDFAVDGVATSAPTLATPQRQASIINAEWKLRFLEDSAANRAIAAG